MKNKIISAVMASLLMIGATFTAISADTNSISADTSQFAKMLPGTYKSAADASQPSQLIIRPDLTATYQYKFMGEGDWIIFDCNVKIESNTNFFLAQKDGSGGGWTMIDRDTLSNGAPDPEILHRVSQ